MKKILLLFLPLMMMACSNGFDEPKTKTKVAKTNIIFNIASTPQTRAASVNDNWPTTSAKTQAEYVVDKIYTAKKSVGTSFFTDNYTVNLVNDKGGSITSWTGSTKLSLTETNNITVELSTTDGAYPKFKKSTGTIDISNIDLDVASPDISKAVCTGDISVSNIIVDSNGRVNVTIVINLTYDSFLIVAPSDEFSVLSTTKGFNNLKWGGNTGTDFNTTTSSDGKKWFYWWGTNSGYIYGKGAIMWYGFNISTSGTDIIVENGKWYALFASWNSVGEDANTTGLQPVAGDLVNGGVIR